MKVKVSNHRSGSIDYVSQALKLSVPGYTKDMLVELPAATADRWVAQLQKDGLQVQKVYSASESSSAKVAEIPKTTTTAPKTEVKKESSTSSSGSNTSSKPNKK